jgi:hypothetical protein
MRGWNGGVVGGSRLAADLDYANVFFLDGKQLAGETVPLVDDRREPSMELSICAVSRAADGPLAVSNSA